MSPSLPEDFSIALDTSAWVKAAFFMLSPIEQTRYIAWVDTAKRPETRAKRIRVTIKMIEEWHVTGGI